MVSNKEERQVGAVSGREKGARAGAARPPGRAANVLVKHARRTTGSFVTVRFTYTNNTLYH